MTIIARKFYQFFYPLPKYTENFIKADFQLTKYLLMGLFIALCIGINYWFNFEDTYVQVHDFYARFFRYIGFYSFAYFGGVMIVSWKGGGNGFIKKKQFWVLSVLAMIIIAFDGSYHGAYDISRALVPREVYLYVGKLFTEFRNFLTILLPLFVIWLVTKEKDDSFYGLTFQNVWVKPYLLLLLIMLPLILLAAQSASFLETYPLFKTFGAENYWHISRAWLAAPYEFLYGSSFLSVELFFRGFLVIGMIKIMGKDAILPMVGLYAFLHFGKPMGEAISSVFGGYLLGIFAYYSRNIWGGVFVHGGIALMMETIAGIVKM